MDFALSIDNTKNEERLTNTRILVERLESNETKT